MNKVARKHLYEEKYNNQGSLMKIVEYNGYRDIIVEFQDKYKTKIHTTYDHFSKGKVKNPYYPNVFGVGMIGAKYPASINCKPIKEYTAWIGMLRRSFDEKTKEKNPTYRDVTCCDEWLLFENFYEWLHSQENFEKWFYGDLWAVDKDILIKGNKIYSPNTCCLVSNDINQLFKKENFNGNDSSIIINLQAIISESGNNLQIKFKNPFTNETEIFDSYQDLEQMLQIYRKQIFLGYKVRKENIIKQTAQEEYAKGNIIEKCYEAMMNYEVEINDCKFY